MKTDCDCCDASHTRQPIPSKVQAGAWDYCNAWSTLLSTGQTQVVVCISLWSGKWMQWTQIAAILPVIWECEAGLAQMFLHRFSNRQEATTKAVLLHCLQTLPIMRCRLQVRLTVIVFFQDIVRLSGEFMSPSVTTFVINCNATEARVLPSVILITL